MSNDMHHHIKVYRNVFIGLLIFTVLTVAASYFHFNYVWVGVGIGLLIAFIKGYLVAANFMHLNNEKNIIYLILAMTVVFFLVLFFMPTMWHNNGLKSPGHVPIQNGETLKVIEDNSHGGH